MLVEKTPLAAFSQRHRIARKGDFLDCYRARRRAPEPLPETTQKLLTGMPGWVNTLMAARDRAVAPLGLKTAAAPPSRQDRGAELRVGEPVSFFCVRSLAEDEIILGEDDAHLDFRISVHRDHQDPSRVGVATWVRTKRRSGGSI